MPLHELVYVSLAEHPMSDEELRQLLAQARAHNVAHGITGLLVYRDREFMQLLEGEEAEVAALFQHIERDRRHLQVYRLWDGPIAERSCRDWVMGFAEPTDESFHALPDGRRVVDEGLFAAGRSSAGKRILLNLIGDLMSRQVDVAAAAPRASQTERRAGGAAAPH